METTSKKIAESLSKIVELVHDEMLDCTGGLCHEEYDNYSCCRPEGHTGFHVAEDGTEICLVWGWYGRGATEKENKT